MTKGLCLLRPTRRRPFNDKERTLRVDPVPPLVPPGPTLGPRSDSPGVDFRLSCVPGPGSTRRLHWPTEGRGRLRRISYFTVERDSLKVRTLKWVLYPTDTIGTSYFCRKVWVRNRLEPLSSVWVPLPLDTSLLGTRPCRGTTTTTARDGGVSNHRPHPRTGVQGPANPYLTSSADLDDQIHK